MHKRCLGYSFHKTIGFLFEAQRDKQEMMERFHLVPEMPAEAVPG